MYNSFNPICTDSHHLVQAREQNPREREQNVREHVAL